MSAYKKVQPKRFSYVAAVKKYGDQWRVVAPFQDYSELRTQDWFEANAMESMERGEKARVYVIS